MIEGLTDAGSAIRALRPLQTKISIPTGVPGTVRRAAVEAVLDRGARVTTVIGAAGFGKTTAVAQWASRQADPVAWYTIDTYDGRPSVFWRHAAAAIAAAEPTPAAAGSDEDGPGAVYDVSALLATIGAEPDPLVLILDDAHLVEDETILGELAYFIERAPAAFRFVIAARLRPALPWGRWAARHELAEVPEAALSFDPVQSAALLRATAGCDVSDEIVAQLSAAASGWPAMLSLAGYILSRRDRPSDGREPMLPEDHLILDYVVNEVLARLDDSDREAAMLMSLLDELDPRRCELLCGVPDGHRVLGGLARQGIPMVLLDPATDSWRFHSLIRAVLRAELERAHDGELAGLHARAAEVERAVDNRPAAVRHLIAAGAVNEAFAILFAPLGEMYRSGSVEAMAQWIDLFPPDFIAASAERSATFALAMAFLGRRAELEQWVRHNSDLDPTASTELDLALTKPRMLEAIDRGDTAALRRELVGLQERQGTDVLDRTREYHVAVIMTIASVVDDRPVEAERWAKTVVRWPDVPERTRAVGQPTRAAWVAYLRGSLEQSARIAEAALAAGGEVGNIALHARIELYALHAALALEWLDLDRAEYWLARCRALTAPMHPCLHRYIADRVAFAVVEARRGPDAAASAATSAASPAPPTVAARYQVLAAEFNARAGRPDRAARQVAALPASARRSLVLARIGEQTGNRTDISAALRSLTGFGELPRALRIEAELLRARVRPASRALARALDAGAAAGYVWTFLREGETLAEELRRATADDGRWSGNRLVSALCEPTDVTDRAPARLSRAETRVLRMLASHRTQTEIARELRLSVNTVKTQVRFVYRKLGVTHRSEAVARARDAGLLEPH